MTNVTKEEFVKNLTDEIRRKNEKKDREYYEYMSDRTRDTNLRQKRNILMKNVYSEV